VAAPAVGAGVGRAADPGLGELGVELGEQLLQPGRVLAERCGLVVLLLGFGAFFQ
jgi:hypothetical protein